MSKSRQERREALEEMVKQANTRLALRWEGRFVAVARLSARTLDRIVVEPYNPGSERQGASSSETQAVPTE